MKVIGLYIYPIKGMIGSKISTARVLERGFEHDRRYMLVDKDGTFISQRTHPVLVSMKPEIVGNELVVKCEGKALNILLEESLENVVSTTIFDSVVAATEVSHEANEWFSAIMNQDVRLVKMTEHNVRHKALIKGPDHTEVSFADGYPYLIAGTESLRELNSKLESPIELDRFRANIIVDTTESHIEDSWEDISIGDTQFLVIKPCARCPVVTVDQKSGVRSKEPLKTLATYRKKDNKVYFGTNAISRGVGYVHIGDEVVIL